LYLYSGSGYALSSSDYGILLTKKDMTEVIHDKLK